MSLLKILIKENGGSASGPRIKNTINKANNKIFKIDRSEMSNEVQRMTNHVSVNCGDASM